MHTKIIHEYYRIAANHPCLTGHFPGQPIIPAVVQLDYVRRLLQQWQPEKRLIAIPHAKFQRPLLPDQDFLITLTELDTESIRFECACEGKKLATGSLRIEARV